MDPWTDQHHQDVSYQNQLQFQNITMIQKLEDIIKQLVILLILIKFHYQHHIQDKTHTTSSKPKEHQSRENQKKFQSSIPHSLKPTLPSTDKMMTKVQPKEPQSRENLKKYQSSIPQSLRPTQPSTDKMMNKVQPKEHQSRENQKKYQSLTPQSLKHIPLFTDKERNNNE